MEPKYAKQRYTKNDAILSKYILNKTNKGEQLPYISEIAKETGVSIATISRYAKRRGYYSFGELRANFNKNENKENFDDKGLTEFFLESKKIAIVASKFTEILGLLIRNRLNDLRMPVRIVNNYEELEPDEEVLAITLSGDSLKIRKLLDSGIKNNIRLLTTTGKYKDKRENVTTITLDEFEYIQDDRFDGHMIIRKIFIWLDDILNIVHIRKTTSF